MKVKQQPEDFQVEELTDVTAGHAGPFAFYRLTKRGWTTPDALAAVRRRWKVDHRRLSYGGLKDRHALTTQYLTIFRGPKRKLTHHGVTVEYLGQLPEAYTSQQIRANRFHITLRALPAGDVPALEAAVDQVRRDGLPNYFDDQRFGSVTPDGGFVAREMVLGRHEEALKLALAGAYEHDRAEQKKEKSVLLRHWGDWPACKDLLPRGHARSLVTYLCDHPQDFRGALERLRPELRGLYLSAYQSDLWNRMLAMYLSDHFIPERLLALPLRRGDCPAAVGLTEEEHRSLSALSLPLPSPRGNVDNSDPSYRYLEAVLAEEGVTLEQMKLKKLPSLFFSKGERAAWFDPAGLQYNVGDDGLNPGRRAVELAFDLPRGSYATLVVKRVTAARTWVGGPNQ